MAEMDAGDATEQPTRIVVIQKTKVSPPLG